MTFLLTFDGVLKNTPMVYRLSPVRRAVASPGRRSATPMSGALASPYRFANKSRIPRALRPGIESICLLARPPPPRRARLIDNRRFSCPVRRRPRPGADGAGIRFGRPRPPDAPSPRPARYFEIRAVDAVLRENLARAFVIDAAGSAERERV